MSSAEKLLARMMASKADWGEDDLHQLYLGFGFQYKAGAKHNFYFHPTHRGLYATVSRQKSLPTGYIQHAIKLIRQLKQLEAESHG